MKVIGPNIIPLIGFEYIHVKSGNRYTVKGLCRLKLPTGEWVDGIRYSRTDGSSKISYVRTISDFQSSFADADGIVEV